MSKAAVILLAVLVSSGCPGNTREQEGKGMNTAVSLPSPRTRGELSVEEAINRRHSVRNFKDEPLELGYISQILWAAGGSRIDAVSSATRTYPSAGGIYPQEFFVFAGNIKGLDPGLYRYNHTNHTLELSQEGDLRRELAAASLGQSSPRTAPATIAIAADYERMMNRYGDRGIRYVHMDAGHSGENIYLAAASLGLGTVALGAFNDSAVNSLAGLPENLDMIYLFPLGKPE